MIRVGLVDDHTLVRQGLRSLLAMVDGIEVAMEASDGEEALAALADCPVDVLLLDLRMPRAGGLDVLRALRGAGGPAPPAVVVLTTFQDDTELWGALRLGARGYLLKDVSLERLVGAIQTVHAGGTFIQPALTERVVRDLAAPGADAGEPAESLTTRETEVLRLMAAGFSNREIADGLGMAEGTVKNHVSSILGKLGVKDRTRAVLTAIENGLV